MLRICKRKMKGGENGMDKGQTLVPSCEWQIGELRADVPNGGDRTFRQLHL